MKTKVTMSRISRIINKYRLQADFVGPQGKAYHKQLLDGVFRIPVKRVREWIQTQNDGDPSRGYKLLMDGTELEDTDSVPVGSRLVEWSVDKGRRFSYQVLVGRKGVKYLGGRKGLYRDSTAHKPIAMWIDRHPGGVHRSRE